MYSTFAGRHHFGAPSLEERHRLHEVGGELVHIDLCDTPLSVSNLKVDVN